MLVRGISSQYHHGVYVMILHVLNPVVFMKTDHAFVDQTHLNFMLCIAPQGHICYCNITHVFVFTMIWKQRWWFTLITTNRCFAHIKYLCTSYYAPHTYTCLNTTICPLPLSLLEHVTQAKSWQVFKHISFKDAPGPLIRDVLAAMARGKKKHNTNTAKLMQMDWTLTETKRGNVDCCS